MWRGLRPLLAKARAPARPPKALALADPFEKGPLFGLRRPTQETLEEIRVADAVEVPVTDSQAGVPAVVVGLMGREG